MAHRWLILFALTFAVVAPPAYAVERVRIEVKIKNATFRDRVSSAIRKKTVEPYPTPEKYLSELVKRKLVESELLPPVFQLLDDPTAAADYVLLVDLLDKPAIPFVAWPDGTEIAAQLSVTSTEDSSSIGAPSEPIPVVKGKTTENPTADVPGLYDGDWLVKPLTLVIGQWNENNVFREIPVRIVRSNGRPGVKYLREGSGFETELRNEACKLPKTAKPMARAVFRVQSVSPSLEQHFLACNNDYVGGPPISAPVPADPRCTKIPPKEEWPTLPKTKFTEVYVARYRK